MGYRRIRDELDGHKGIHVNDKRVLRICRKYDIKSNIKWKPKSCTRGDRNPDHIAKNYLHREFHAEKPNEKWLTDVSEFKYYSGIEVHKVYLSVETEVRCLNVEVVARLASCLVVRHDCISLAEIYIWMFIISL